MTTHTVNALTADIQEFLTGDNAGAFQAILDDALVAAELDMLYTQTAATVVVNVLPPDASVAGESKSITWSKENIREYLRPPGDSTKYQPEVNDALNEMMTSATNTNTITSVVFTLNPA